MQDQEPRQPDTARACAKDLIRPYVLDGWTWQEISKGHMSSHGGSYAAQVGAQGGSITDYQGNRHSISRQQMAVTQIARAPCWVVFDLLELMAEIRDEARGYEPQPLSFKEPEEEEPGVTLADFFTQPPPAPVPRKRPVIFRSYMAGYCKHCGAELGYIEADGGRDREYCDNGGKCRQAYHRARKREEKRAAILQYHGQLREYWYEHRIDGQLLAMLQEILIKHGKEAARAATDAVLVARKEQVKLMGLANQYRLEPPRPPRIT